MENEMETGVVGWCLGLLYYGFIGAMVVILV